MENTTYKIEDPQQNLVMEPFIAYITENEVQHSIKPVYKTTDTAYNNDSMDVLAKFTDNYAGMIFADPPYNLSNGGITCHAGKMVSVNKEKCIIK